MLVWMDLEMTGLDPSRHVIVEIATLITDDDLVTVAEGPDIVVHAGDEQLAQMDGVVRRMHTRSGLLAAIEASSTSGRCVAKKRLSVPMELPQSGTDRGCCMCARRNSSVCRPASASEVDDASIAASLSLIHI